MEIKSSTFLEWIYSTSRVSIVLLWILWKIKIVYPIAYLLQKRDTKSCLENAFRRLYQLCLDAIFTMWALGIVHHQMSMASILYDKSRDEVKIVDYSRAYMPADLKTFSNWSAF
eukprot:UN15508